MNKVLVLMLLFLACKSSKEPMPTAPDNRVFYKWDEFTMGVDLSYVNAIQDYGGTYSDSGKVEDPYSIFKKYGANVVRVRLWHNPQWQAALNNGRLYNDLKDVEKTISRAKNAGMAVNLDLHYSDTWADPSHQEMPAAWVGLSLNVLKDSVYNYTLATLNYLKSKNLTPEMIQIGNETNQGMMFPTGKVTGGNFTSFAALVNSGIKAVRDFSVTSDIKPQVILHVAQYKNAEYYINGLVQKGVTDFDILGISHYENWSDGYSFTQIETITQSLKNQYNKKIMVMETACPWTSNNADAYGNIIPGTTPFSGFPVTQAGQLDYMKALTQSVIKGGGSGVMYWEPAWITSSMKDLWGTGSAWENNALFDFTGKALPGMGYMTHAYTF